MSRAKEKDWAPSFVAKWRSRAAEAAELGNQEAPAIIACILGDLERRRADFDAELLTPTEAQEWSGKHPDSLSRMVREGKLRNYGSKHRPLYRRSDLQPKPATKPWPSVAGAAKIPSTRMQIARAVAHRHGGDE